MTDTQPLAEVKARFSTYVDRVARERERVLITRNGRPAAVLISPDDLASLEETLDILSDPVAVAEIRQSQAEIARGETYSLEQVLAERQKMTQSG